MKGANSMTEYAKYGDYTKQNEQPENLKTAITFLAIGAGVGALISLLLAPRSGPETREAIRDTLDSARRGLTEHASKLRSKTFEAADQARQRVMPISRTQ
jgi:gas vesicle protein